MNKPKVKYPGHRSVRLDSRICFAIKWYATEKEADEMGAYSRAIGNTYNGGMFHGMACGRDKSWDMKDENGNMIYAITQ